MEYIHFINQFIVLIFLIVYFYQRYERNIFIEKYAIKRNESGLLQNIKDYYIGIGLNPKLAEEISVKKLHFFIDNFKK